MPAPQHGGSRARNGHGEQPSLSDRYHGRTPPDHADGWEVTTVGRRFVDHGREGETVMCQQTGEDIPIDEPHLHVTIRRESGGYQPTIVHLAFRDEAALEAWFDGE